MQWSLEQVTIFDEIPNSARHIIIDSVAGSGKSTTAFELLKIILKDKPYLKCALLAFNTFIARKFGEFSRSYEAVSGSTYHSFGFNLIKNANKSARVSPNKYKKYLEEAYPGDTIPYEVFNTLLSCLFKIRSLSILSPSEDEIFAILMGYKLFNENSPYRASDFCDKLRVISDKIDQDMTQITFQDMIRLPVIHKLRAKYDLVVIDEYQDTDPMQFELLKHLESQGARVILIGDDDQAIYYFRGAMLEVSNSVRSHFKCQQYFLSKTYRCDKKIAKFVVDKQVATKTFISEQTYDGSCVLDLRIGTNNVNKALKTVYKAVVKILIDNNFNIAAVVSARNTTIMQIWLELAINHNVFVKFKNTDIVEPIMSTLSKYSKLETTSALERAIGSKISRHYNETDPYMLDQATLENYELVIIALQMLPDLTTIAFVQERLLEFKKHESTNPLELTTVHSSKGLEYDSVIVPGDWFQSPQETQMKYVAWTRAIRQLININILRHDDELFLRDSGYHGEISANSVKLFDKYLVG